MGLTAEAVAKEHHVTREDQDEFSYNSHQKAIKAIEAGLFQEQIVPITIEETYVDENGKKKTRSYVVDADEGPRADTSIDKLAKLKPVFAQNGTVTAGNASQTSDGAAFVIVMSERMVKELNLEPIARMVTYATGGVDPRIMGMGPIAAVPKAIKQAGLHLNDIDLFEINEAFAAQTLAVIRHLEIPEEKLNVSGGAIATGHPLGCSGAKLSIQQWHELRRRKQKYGLVTACVGGGQGVAGIYELLS
jgi:acetyl-CoA acetyltransferase family protein